MMKWRLVVKPQACLTLGLKFAPKELKGFKCSQTTRTRNRKFLKPEPGEKFPNSEGS